MARRAALRALLLGTLAVGVLDGLDAIIFFGVRSGTSAIRIFQGIAAGLLGPASYRGGWRTALLGVALHFFIAFAIVAVFHLASRRLRALTRHPIVTGALYGLAVYVVMNFEIIPMSAIPPRQGPIPLAVLINGLLIHAFGVGVPAALSAKAAARTAV